jgi:hypothetical protein
MIRGKVGVSAFATRASYFTKPTLPTMRGKVGLVK